VEPDITLTDPVTVPPEISPPINATNDLMVMDNADDDDDDDDDDGYRVAPILHSREM
jgi:hypothetical protein